MTGGPPERKWDFDRVFRLLLTAATVVALFFFVRYLGDVLIPFAIALLLAYLLNPIVNALDSRFERRGLSVFITVFGCGVVMFCAGLVLFHIGYQELNSLRDLTGQFVHTPTKADVRNARAAFEEWADTEENPVIKALLNEARARLVSQPKEQLAFRQDLDRLAERATSNGNEEALREAQARIFPGDPADLHLREDLERILADTQNEKDRATIEQTMRELRYDDNIDISIGGLIEKGVRYVAPTVVGFFSGTLSFVLGITGLVVVLLYLIFLLIDYPLMVRTWKGFLPPKYRGDIIGFLDEFRIAMSRYFRGQFIIAIICGVLFAIGFSILGLRLAVLLGLGIGLLNMVPYLQTVGLIPALLLGFIKGLESGQPLWLPPLLVLVVFAVVQLVQDGVLVPKIMGKSVGLRPVVILLGIFIWGKLLGFLGLLIAIPLTCLGVAYYRRFVLGDRNAKAIEDSGE
ncbi:MAG: AI-2E family transporter [Phycisphaerales bacterium]|nr:AI-2E family transporter [Phycisphaerales bacterium]